VEIGRWREPPDECNRKLRPVGSVELSKKTGDPVFFEVAALPCFSGPPGRVPTSGPSPVAHATG
jgi:hypothetical protein